MEEETGLQAACVKAWLPGPLHVCPACGPAGSKVRAGKASVGKAGHSLWPCVWSPGANRPREKQLVLWGGEVKAPLTCS